MSKYFFSFWLVFFASFYSQAQDTLVAAGYAKRYGLRAGVDVYRLTRSLYDKKYTGFEMVGDYRIKNNTYLAGEIGSESLKTSETLLNFDTQGMYLKVGFDYNLYENWLNMENMIYIGFRYSISRFSQTLNSYQVYYNTNVPDGGIPNNFFEQETVYVNRKFSGLSAHWLEFVTGLKVEVFHNFYAGFSVRLNALLSDKKPDNFDNLYIPGFNRTYSGRFGMGYNYTLSYLIPFYKKNKTTMQPAD